MQRQKNDGGSEEGPGGQEKGSGENKRSGQEMREEEKGGMKWGWFYHTGMKIFPTFLVASKSVKAMGKL